MLDLSFLYKIFIRLLVIFLFNPLGICHECDIMCLNKLSRSRLGDYAMIRRKKMVVKKYSRRHEKIRKRLVYIIIASLLLVGIIYQNLGIYNNVDKLGRVGSLIEVNGVNMHLYTAGNGDLPIVFTSDIGQTMPYIDTYNLHSSLANETSVAVYDKPGYGWSDYTSAPRDIDTIVDEIHTLFEESELSKPFIYVAHGMGSFEAIRYAQLYPDDVAGIVLIDGASPSFGAEFNNIMIVESFMINGARNVGLLRLGQNTDYVSRLLCMNNELPEHLKLLSRGINLEKLWNRNIISEKLKVPENAQTILDDGDLGDIPLRIITSEASPYSNWGKSQNSMRSLTTDFAQYYMTGSVDYIENQDVPQILSVINELLASIREARENY